MLRCNKNLDLAAPLEELSLAGKASNMASLSHFL